MEHIIHPLYLKKESIEQLQKSWNKKETFPHLVLTKFLTKETYTEKEKELKKLFFKRESRPDKYSYAHAKSSSLHLFDNKDLQNFLSIVLNTKIKSILGEAQYFSWKDYTILSKDQEKASLDIILDFTEDWKEEWGGSMIYKDNKGKYLKLMALPNTLIVVERKNAQKYTQYINNLAKGKKRYLLIGTLKTKSL